MPHSIAKIKRAIIYIRDKQRCVYCGGLIPKPELTIDHVHPKCKGGLKTYQNLVTSCEKCNIKKGKMYLSVFLRKVIQDKRKAKIIKLRVKKAQQKNKNLENIRNFVISHGANEVLKEKLIAGAYYKS